MSNYTVEYYETKEGKLPVEEFILTQSTKMRAKIFRTLELLEIKGNELREPYSKHIDDGIFEVRIKVGNNVTRILFFVVGHKAILTNGFVKRCKKHLRRNWNWQKDIEQTIYCGIRRAYNMGKNFRETLNVQLKNPDFKAEWDALEPEFQVIQAMLQGRKENNITQKQLADKTGITQADISRLENGESNPSLSTLKRIAEGLGMKLRIEFIPIKEKHL